MALVVAAFLGLLTMTELGVYLERSLYLTPYFRAVTALGFGPKLDPTLRVVMADDASQYLLGRQPTLAEWRAIAKVLVDKGFERVLLAGATKVDGEFGNLADSEPPGGFFAAGAVGYVQGNSVYVPDGARSGLGDKALPLGDEKAAPHLRDLKLVLGTRREVRRNVDAFGHLNRSSDQTVPFAYRFGDRVLPYLGLLATPALRVENGGLADDRGALPQPFDGEFYVDFPPLSDVLGRAVPSSAFFTKKSQQVSPELSQRVATVLEGGKVALLIPDAVSGGKLVTTPFGGYPAFTVPIAMASSSLTRHLLHAPIAQNPLIVALGLLAAVLAARLSFRHANFALGATLLVTVAVPTSLLYSKGYVLPVFGMASVTAAAWITRLAYFFASTWKQKMLASKDLEMGRTIQSLLLPAQREGRAGGWSYRIVFEPYGPMSGDWYQSYHVKDETQDLRAVLAIGDVIGKGPSAALNTATITAVWKRHESLFEKSPEDLTPFLADLAQAIDESYRGEQNTSIQLAALYRDRVKIISCAAPFWLKMSGGADPVRVRNKAQNPLGMRLGPARYQMVEAPAVAGDVYLAHTDGVMEGGECFARFAARVKAQSLDFETVSSAAREAGKGLVLPDDVTMLIIRKEREGGEHELPSQEVG